MWESRVLRRAFERLELHEGKLSRAVLRGGGGGDVTSLPDTWVGNHPGLPGPSGCVLWSTVRYGSRFRRDVIPRCPGDPLETRPSIRSSNLLSTSAIVSGGGTPCPARTLCICSIFCLKRRVDTVRMGE